MLIFLSPVSGAPLLADGSEQREPRGPHPRLAPAGQHVPRDVALDRSRQPRKPAFPTHRQDALDRNDLRVEIGEVDVGRHRHSILSSR
jgi:hypothetical protein